MEFSQIPHLIAFHNEDRSVKLIAQVMQINPELNYFALIRHDFETKMQWGKERGFVERWSIDKTPVLIGEYQTLRIETVTPDNTITLLAIVYDARFPYRVVQLTLLAPLSHAEAARVVFQSALQTLKLEWDIASTVSGFQFRISEKCQRHWIITDAQSVEAGDVFLIIQEPHWDKVAHWHLHQGLKLFFEENPGLLSKSAFLAEGVPSDSKLSLAPLLEVEPNPSVDLMIPVLHSFLVTGYMTYDWSIGGTIPILGTEDWPLYRESARLWLHDEADPWAVTVAARNRRIVETLLQSKSQFANPVLFVGGMHLHKINNDVYFKGHAALPANSPSSGKGNQGIIDLLVKQGIRYIYIEPVPSMRGETMTNKDEIDRYRMVFRAQESQNYAQYIANSVKEMRSFEIYGELPSQGVTVSPQPKEAANLVRALREGDDDDGHDRNQTKGSKDDPPKGSPTITLADIVNKTKKALRDLAKRKGLMPDPDNDARDPWKRETYLDPVTKKKRLGCVFKIGCHPNRNWVYLNHEGGKRHGTRYFSETVGSLG